MSNDSPSTWKEWAIQVSTKQDVYEENLDDLYAKYDNLQSKYDDLKEKFIRLETRVYIMVPVIVILIEIGLSKLFK